MKNLKSVIKTIEKKRAKAVKDANWVNDKLCKHPHHLGYLIEWNNHLTSASIYSEILDMLDT